MPQYDEEQVRHIELMSAALEKGQSFNSFFIAVGYATFFALWANLKGCATPTSHLIAGAFLSVSVVIYVIWMVGGLFALNRTMVTLIEQVESNPRQLHQAKPIEPASAIKQLQALIDDPSSDMTPAQRVKWRRILMILKISKLWQYMLAAIVAPALVGMTIVFSVYIHGAWLSFQGAKMICG